MCDPFTLRVYVVRRATRSQSASGVVGSTNSQHVAPARNNTPVRYSGALQFAKWPTMSATRVGLSIEPICPEVFIAPLNDPALLRPTSMQVPQAAPRRKFDEAPPSAISTAAHTGDAMKVPRIVNVPAAARAAPPIAVRPIRRPNRRTAASVATPPNTSAIALRISGSPARMAPVIPVSPRSPRYVGSHVT